MGGEWCGGPVLGGPRGGGAQWWQAGAVVDARGAVGPGCVVVSMTLAWPCGPPPRHRGARAVVHWRVLGVGGLVLSCCVAASGGRGRVLSITCSGHPTSFPGSLTSSVCCSVVLPSLGPCPGWVFPCIGTRSTLARKCRCVACCPLPVWLYVLVCGSREEFSPALNQAVSHDTTQMPGTHACHDGNGPPKPILCIVTTNAAAAVSRHTRRCLHT